MPPSPRHAVPLTVAALVAGLAQPMPAMARSDPAHPAAVRLDAAAGPAPAARLGAAAGPAPAAQAVTVAAMPGTVRTTVRDALTGADVRACLSLVPVDRDRLTVVGLGEEQAGRHGGCTGVEGGDLVATDVPPGRYHLLAR